MAGAAGTAAIYARRVMVGGLLVEMDPDTGGVIKL
jgi:hypothetical protein